MPVLERFFAIYTKAGFEVDSVHANPEFRLVLDLVKTSLDAKVNYWNTAEHVPEADNNLVIQERTRATAHRLHYQSLLKTAIKVLVMESTKCLSIFPLRGGVSNSTVRESRHPQRERSRAQHALPLGKQTSPKIEQGVHAKKQRIDNTDK